MLFRFIPVAHLPVPLTRRVTLVSPLTSLPPFLWNGPVTVLLPYSWLRITLHNICKALIVPSADKLFSTWKLLSSSSSSSSLSSSMLLVEGFPGGRGYRLRLTAVNTWSWIYCWTSPNLGIIFSKTREWPTCFSLLAPTLCFVCRVFSFFSDPRDVMLATRRGRSHFLLNRDL